MHHERGEQRAERQGEKAGGRAHPAGLRGDELEELAARQPLGAHHRELAAALELERGERRENAEEGDGDRQQAEDAGDAEGAVEDLDRHLLEQPARLRGELAFRSRAFDRLLERCEVGAGEGEDRQHGHPRIAEVGAKARLGKHGDALVRAVVVVDADDAERPGALRSGELEAVAQVEVAAVGERLGEDHGIVRRGELAPGGLEVPLLEVVGSETLAVEVDADDARRQLARALDQGHAQGVDALDSGQSADALDRFGRDPQVGAARHLGRRADVEIADQRAFEPDLDRGAEAADHHRDARRHGDREGQRGHRDAGARDRCRDRPRAHPAEEPHQPPRCRGDRAHRRGERQRDEEREADQDEEEAAERERQRAFGERQHGGAGETEEETRERSAAGQAAGAALELRAQECRARRRVGGFERRCERRGERSAEAEEAALEERQRREREAPRSQGEIEIANRLQDEPHESAPEDDAQEQPERAADEAEDGGLAENHRQDLAAPHAEGAQAAEELATLDDREGHRVVDQEGAAEQGEERQGAEVEAKRPRHLLERLGAGGGAGEMHARRQQRREVPARRFARLALGQGEIDPRQAPGQVEDLLRGGDIDQREVGERLASGVVGRPDDSDEEELLAAGADLHREAVADREPESRCGRTLEQHRTGRGEEADEIASRFESPASAGAEEAAERRFAPRIEAEEAQHARRAVDFGSAGRCRPGQDDEVFDDGRRCAHPGELGRAAADAGEERLVEAVRVAGDLVGGPAGGGVGGDGEGAAGALVGEVDRHHDRDAQSDAGQGESELGRMAQVIAPAGAPEEGHRSELLRPAVKAPPGAGARPTARGRG